MTDSRVLRASCPCGRMPDPGYKAEVGGCLCPGPKYVLPAAPGGRRKPALFFQAGQWWAMCAERADSLNLAALAWVEDRNVV